MPDAVLSNAFVKTGRRLPVGADLLAGGGVHFRVYRAGRLGMWEAHANNPDYQPLLSDRDGLKVLAVLTAVEGRWS